MTVQGNEQVQPAPIDPSVTPPAAIPPEVLSTDPDDIELREALAAAQAEETAPAPIAATPVATGAANAPATAVTTVPPEQKQPLTRPQMIPKPRFDEVNDAKAKAEQDAAYWRGVAEARGGTAGTTVPGQTPQAPAAPAPEQRIAELRAQKQAATKRFDAGEIGASELEVMRDEIDDKVHAIREEVRTKSAPVPEAKADNSELFLETLTQQLEVDNPWVKVFDQVGSDADWTYLKGLAHDRLAANGIDPAEKSATVTFERRKAMAELATEFGPALLTTRATKAGVALPGPAQTTQQQPQQPGRTALSPTAQARVNKLALAASAPPDISRMSNAGGANAGEATAAAIENMTDDEIAALPKAVQDKILLSTPA